MACNDSSARAPMLEHYLSVSELSEATGIPKRTIYDAIQRGELARFVPNGLRRGFRVAESEARRWLEASTRHVS